MTFPFVALLCTYKPHRSWFASLRFGSVRTRPDHTPIESHMACAQGCPKARILGVPPPPASVRQFYVESVPGLVGPGGEPRRREVQIGISSNQIAVLRNSRQAAPRSAR